MLIGTSAQPGVFSGPIVTGMAAHVARPIIMPLSNPTSRSEGVPADLIGWTEGRALVAAGSPFPAVSYGGVRYDASTQANNALLFPGIGLGVTVARARRLSDGMLAAAAAAVAGLSGAGPPGAAILPPVTSLRSVSAAVARAVARAAAAEVWPGSRWIILTRRWRPRCGLRLTRRSRRSEAGRIAGRGLA